MSDTEDDTQPAEATKKCPFCAETIKAEAIVCRFCGRDLAEPNSQSQATPIRLLSQISGDPPSPKTGLDIEEESIRKERLDFERKKLESEKSAAQSKAIGEIGKGAWGCGCVALLLYLALFVFGPCGSSTTSEDSQGSVNRTGQIDIPSGFTNGIHVTREMFGEGWPLTVEEGDILTKGPGVVFRTMDGTLYAVNGLAKGWASEFGWEKYIDPIWKDATDGVAPKVSIGPLIFCGLNIEEGKPCISPDAR